MARDLEADTGTLDMQMILISVLLSLRYSHVLCRKCALKNPQRIRALKLQKVCDLLATNLSRIIN